MLQGDMKNREIRIHPNQKPVRLYEWLLREYANPGGSHFRHARRERVKPDRLSQSGV